MDTKLAKNIQTYIELVYSEKSDMNIIQDLGERKKMACEKSKLDYNSDAIQSIVNMKDLIVNEQIFEFLRTQNSNDYVLLISDQHLFWELMQRNAKPMAESGDAELKDCDLKLKISEKCEPLLDRIKARYKSIFIGEAEQKVAENKMKTAEQRLKGKKST